ncbi:MAG: 2-succinyl-6-hydroxy-2,4-cyclohexadiene-1-carboxylate synthase [Ignavibacteria bacterium]|nr:2-succinyl-6-hydroxy-2,4-cyclohexadiene-1-carboxylate synthase [Ignavibacteria bacterium]
MIIKVDDIEFNIVVDEKKLKSDTTPVIFLHGFTGNANDWNFIFDKLPSPFLPVAIDLIGHGKSSSPDNPKYYTNEAIICQLNKIIKLLELDKFIIVGYSMGGRVALSYSIRYNRNILGAIFESSTAGIQDFNQRKERVELDFLLSEKIKLEGIEKFLEYWFSIPLFESLKDINNLEEVKNQRTTNNVIGLSNMLAGFSTGLMPDYWDRIKEIQFPVLLVSGQVDEKFTGINSKMAGIIPNCRHEIIANCGHNTHLENPELFTKFVRDFLISIQVQKVEG